MNIYVSSAANRDFVNRVKASPEAIKILSKHRLAGDFAVAALRLLFRDSPNHNGCITFQLSPSLAQPAPTMRPATCVAAQDELCGTLAAATRALQQFLARAETEAEEGLQLAQELLSQLNKQCDHEHEREIAVLRIEIEAVRHERDREIGQLNGEIEAVRKQHGKEISRLTRELETVRAQREVHYRKKQVVEKRDARSQKATQAAGFNTTKFPKSILASK